MKGTIVLIFLSVLLQLNAQNIKNPGFIRQTEPYEFNLPQLGVGFSLPANAGVYVSVFSGKEVMYEIDKKTNYCFNLDYLKNSKTNFFRFSLTNDETQYLRLTITPSAKTDRIYLSEKVRHENGFLEILKSIKSGLGESVSYRYELNEKKQDMHVFGYNGYLFLFSLPTDLLNKSMYEKLISKFEKKLLYQERIKYENRVNSGYYDKEKKKIANYEKEKFRKISGKLSQTTHFEIPDFKMSMSIPSNWGYEMEARRIIDDANGNIKIELDEIDLLNKSVSFYWARGEGLSFMIRYKSKMHKSASGFNNISGGAKQVYKFFKDFKLLIDGIEAGATFYGAPHSGSMDLWFETETGYYSFAFSNIATDNVAIYDRILKSIKIESNLSRKKTTESLASVVNIVPRSPVKFDNLDYSSIAQLQSFKCDLSTVGATLYLPDTPDKYKYGVNHTFGKNPLVLDADSKTSIAPSYENMFVLLYSHSGTLASVDCTIYFRYGDKSTVDEMVADWVRGAPYQVYTPQIYKAGILTANDGSRWGIVLLNEGKMAWIFGVNKDYQIMFNVKADSRKEMEQFCSLIYKFRLK